MVVYSYGECCTFVRIIYDKIDKDQNGEISDEELTSWIQHVQKRYILSDTDRQWQDHIPEDDGKTQLTWEVYMERTYGEMHGIITCYISWTLVSNLLSLILVMHYASRGIATVNRPSVHLP